MNFRVYLFSLVLTSLFVISSTPGLYAGTTGKISGVVTDAASGEPMPGVNVIISGTTMGAASDLQGHYTILNVPPGIYTLKASMIGHKTYNLENVRVSIDLTTTVNFKLEQTVLDAGEEVTVVAERPLVQLDMTSSMSTIGEREIADMPTQSVSAVLELQAGVVNSGGLHIRGGRAGEIAYWVDGVSMTDGFAGGAVHSMENNAIKELQVISGTFNAEYGKAMSGIVNIITKEGSRQYHGQIKGYVGDYISTADIYNVLKRADVVQDSVTGVSRLIEESENPLTKFNPTYNGEFSLSGPVPLAGDRLSFFTNLRYVESEGYLYGRNWYKPQGIPGDSALVPMNPNWHFSGFGKLTYKLSTDIKLNYSYTYQDWENERYYSSNYKYVPLGLPKSFGNTQSHLFSLTHTLSPNTFYDLKVSRLFTESQSYLYEDPTLRPHYFVYIPGDTTRPDQKIDPDTPEGAAILDIAKQEGWSHQWIVDPNNSDGYVHPDSMRAPTSYSYYRAGTVNGHSYRSTAYWLGKLDFTSQVNNTHQLKFGAEVVLHELELDNYTVQAARVEGRDEAIVPYTPMVPDISTLYHDKYDRKPREISAYIQDKAELKDIILNVGLRFDYFDANSVVPADPTDPNIWDPFKEEHIYKNPGAPEDELIEYTPEERRAFMHKKVDPKVQLSPRLGIAYPITDRGVIHFSYGHFFQIPEFRTLYDSPDFKLNSGGGIGIIGNADLKPQKTVQYEIGLQQAIAENVGIDVTLFYKDIRDLIQTSPMIRTARQVVLYAVYENRDYANVRGVTFQLEKRYSNNIYAKVDYSYQIAEGTYSNPTDAFLAYQAEAEPRVNLVPLNWDRRQVLNGQVMWSAKNWTVSLIGKYRTGTPYTPEFAKGARVGGTALIGLRENSEYLPDFSSVDLYVTKKFNFDPMEITLFMYAYNILDQRGQTGVYTDTGTAKYTTNPNLEDVALNIDRVGTAKDFFTRPEWYISPRQIQLGVTLGF
jgi:outer membrane receptor protein involved in Fe transport